MTEQAKPTHSPLGASGAERWMNCPGSVTLLKNLDLGVTDEPDYQREGTAAHEALAKCLSRNLDAWEVVGETFHGTEVTGEMADAIQVFLDTTRPAMAVEGARTYIEYPICHPAHELFYGTLDHAVIVGNSIEVNDFKYGQGVLVEVEDNPQLMYYAYGILRDFPEVVDVTLRIIQPRGFHHDGPVRKWETNAEYIKDWAESTLLPAMDVAQTEQHLDAGKWCRFCPAKLVCPLMTSLFKAAATFNPKEVIMLTTLELGRSYQYRQAVQQYIKALDEEVYRRLFKGDTSADEFVKLVPKKADRVFKVGAEAVFKAKFGDDAITEPKLKSPAQMEKIDVSAKKLVNEWAYTPLTGLTVALASDARPAVKVETTVQAFPNALDIANGAE